MKEKLRPSWLLQSPRVSFRVSPVQEWPVLQGAHQPLPGCQHPEMCCPSPGSAPPVPISAHETVHCALCPFWSFILPSVCAQTRH